MKQIVWTAALLMCVSAAHAQVKNFGEHTTLSGSFVPGALLVGKTLPNSHIKLGEREIKVAADGTFVVGFGRDAALVHALSINTPQKMITVPLKLQSRQYREQRVNGISKKITHPNPKNVTRARADAKKVRAARAIWSDHQHFTQSFIWPAKGRISGVYGSVRYYNGKKGRPHYGVDMAGPTGTDVIAPADGIVRLFVPDMFYSGGTLIIDHGMGVNSTFLHLSKGLVKAGDVVKQGQLIAKTGTTGRSTGPHLDWRMNWHNKRVDPQLLVPKR